MLGGTSDDLAWFGLINPASRCNFAPRIPSSGTDAPSRSGEMAAKKKSPKRPFFIGPVLSGFLIVGGSEPAWALDRLCEAVAFILRSDGMLSFPKGGYTLERAPVPRESTICERSLPPRIGEIEALCYIREKAEPNDGYALIVSKGEISSNSESVTSQKILTAIPCTE